MRLRSLLMGMVATVVAVAPVAATASEPAGVISSVSGNSFVSRDGRLLRAVPSMRLVKGDRVITQANGAAKVAMKDGCTVAVSGSSSAGVSTCGDAKSVDFQRAGYTGKSSALSGGAFSGGFLIAILAVGAIALGIVAATRGSSRPNSP